MSHLLPAVVVFVFAFLFVAELAIAVTLLMTVFAMMRVWLVGALSSHPYSPSR